MPLLAALGPGIIAASAGNDAGGIATYSAAGASYGYALLWMIVVMTFSLVVVQEMAARMGAVTGKGFAALIRERFGIRPTLFAMICLLASNAATSVAEFAGIAAALQLFGVSKYVSVPIAAVVVWLLVVRGSYKNVEKVLLALSSVFFAYVIAAFMAKPDWGLVLKSTFVPTFIPTPAFVLIVIATIGTTIAPWMQFFVQSNMVDKGATVKDLFYQRVDVIGGAVAANIVAWFIIVTTATVLYPRGIAADSAEKAALALAPVAGQYASVAVRDRAVRRIAARGVRAAAHRRLRGHRGVRLRARHRPHLGRGADLQRHLHLRHLLRRGCSCSFPTLRSW